MRHTHPTLHDGAPDPITLHLSFLRRTQAGPATFRVQDTKLGSRTSTLHITLAQPSGNGNGNSNGDGGSGSVRDEVAGYVTCSNMAMETGPGMSTTWELVPPPPSSPSSSSDKGAFPGADLARLARDGRDDAWESFAVSFASMRGASKNVEFFVPAADTAGQAARRGFVEQWMRFRPYGKLARWTDAAVGFLIDMFPIVLESLDEEPWVAEQDQDTKKQGKEGGGRPMYWYPTVLLNVDFKKKLPAEGVEWLYSRVQTKMLKNGRMDLDIVVLDEQGDLVALSNHVALVVGAERNLSARGSNGKTQGAKI